MFDPRDFASDPRTRPEPRPRRDHAKEREGREVVPAGRSAGPATAQNNLAAMYAYGRGVPQDDAEADRSLTCSK